MTGQSTPQFEPWREPMYEGTLLGGDWVPACSFCKAIVLDTAAHTAWHLQLYVVLSSLRHAEADL